MSRTQIVTEHAKKINHQLGQVKKALGKDQPRVDILVVPYDVRMARQQKQKIYVSDPIGNVFMFYPDNTNAMNVLKDVKKVLEVSQIG